MDVSLHKITRRLIVCLACQCQPSGKSQISGSDGEYNVICVYEFNQEEKYVFRELCRFKTEKPQVTKLLYREDCGLIMGCFQGYVELFDASSFASKGKWDSLQPHQHAQQKENASANNAKRNKDNLFDINNFNPSKTKVENLLGQGTSDSTG